MGLRKREYLELEHSDSRIERVSELVQRVRERHRGAVVGPVEKCPVGFPGARISLPNGADVIVGVDLDHPDELFEVVRCSDPGAVVAPDFERTLHGGFTGLTKLSAAEVLQAVARYSRIAVN